MTMTIGILKIELRIPESRSLKDKRRRVKSIKDKIHHSFNVSVSEIGNHDTLNRASLAVAQVGRDKRSVNSNLSRVMRMIEENRQVELLNYHLELM